jgi:penicillin-binding protein 1A
MSFSASSVFLILMVLGQLSHNDRFDQLQPLSSRDQVYESLRLSCTTLNETGPLAGGSLSQLVEFQRESWLRLQRRQVEFVEQHCAQQQQDHLAGTLRDFFLNQYLNPTQALRVNTPSLLWPLSSDLLSSAPTQGPVSEGLVQMGPLQQWPMQEQLLPGGHSRERLRGPVEASERVSLPPPFRSQEDSQLTSSFQCDQDQALADFSREFGAGVEALESQLSLFADFRIPDFIEFWDAFCVEDSQSTPPTALDYDQLAADYNQLLADSASVDLSFLDHFRTSRGADIYSSEGEWIGPFLERGRVLRFTPLQEIPLTLRQAFIAAEDRNFYSHRGLEPQGILRGFFRYMRDGSIEGGSTITQQLVKNLILGSEVSLERKSREMFLARRVEDRISKDQILEAYLNIVYLGRGAQGVGAATQRYFGSAQNVSDLDLNQASFFAGITHSPNRYNPSLTSPDRIKARQSYVLGEMVRSNFISNDEAREILSAPIQFVPMEFPPMSYFQAAVSEEYLRTTWDQQPPPERIQSTQNKALQNFIDQSVQQHLADFEMRQSKVYWRGPLRNIAYLWRNSPTPVDLESQTQVWRDELIKSRSLFSGVQWEVGVLLKTNNQWVIGLIDESGEALTSPLSFGDVGGDWFSGIRSQLQVGDVIFAEKRQSRYFFRVPPTVQMSVVVMDTFTGEVKALSGGSDYSLTPFNRALLGFRQPGSTVKPFSYLAALDQGFLSTDLISQRSLSFPSIPGCTPWSPANYSSSADGSMTLERALVQSNNRATAHLLNEISGNPAQSLRFIHQIMSDFGLYDRARNQTVCYPLILGSNEVSPLRMAVAYAAIANGGWRVTPTFIKKDPNHFDAQPLQSYSRESVARLSQILSRVVTQGTGFALRSHGGRVAGKTGTSSNYRDVWFAGYSNRHVVVAWMGYDQSRLQLPNGRQVSLQMGSGSTGGRLVAPLVNQVFHFLFNTDSEQDTTIEVAEPLTTRVVEYGFDHHWQDQVNTVASAQWLSPHLASQFFVSLEERLMNSQIQDAISDALDSAITDAVLDSLRGSNSGATEPGSGEDSTVPMGPGGGVGSGFSNDPEVKSIDSPGAADPLTREEMNPEVEGVLQEDSWQRMQNRINELIETLD